METLSRSTAPTSVARPILVGGFVRITPVAYKMLLMAFTLVFLHVWLEPQLIAALPFVISQVVDMTMAADRLADAPRARHAKAEYA